MSRATFVKREREKTLAARRRAKLARRIEANRNRRESTSAVTADEDPDLAGIVPGPQPRLWWQIEE